MPDVRDVLERAAAEPHDGPDTERILRRARTLDRRRKAGWAAVPTVVLLVGLLAVPWLGPGPSVILGPGDGAREAFRLPPAGEARPEFLGDGTPVFVVRDREGSVTVVEAFDSFRPLGVGVLVAWCPSAGWFEEFTSGSRFSPAGEWLTGPAPEGLASYEASVSEGMVQVGSRRPRPPRGETAFTPTGQSCEERPLDLVSHRTSGRTLTPEDAVQADQPGWVAVSGVVVRAEGDRPRLCSAIDDPPRCPADAPVVHGIGGPDALVQWRSMEGWFLVRFADGAVTDLVTWQPSFDIGEQTGQVRRFGFIQEIERRGGTVTIEFEPAEWIADPDAPNDYRIEESAEPPMSLELAADVEVFGDIRLNRRGPGLVEMSVDDLLGADELDTISVWITIERGTWLVLRIEEQYRP